MSGNVFTYNQFIGTPAQDPFGIPLALSGYQLPISVPVSAGAAAGGTSGNSALVGVHDAANAPLAYSAAGMEKFGPSPSNASSTHASAQTAPAPNMWATIANALLGARSNPIQIATTSTPLATGPGSVPAVTASGDPRTMTPATPANTTGAAFVGPVGSGTSANGRVSTPRVNAAV